MNKVMGVVLIILFFTSCKKDPVPVEEAAFVSFINTVAGLSQQPSIFIDTAFQFRIPYRATYRNLKITPGPHMISIRDSSRIKTFVSFAAGEFIDQTTSTIIVYDTLHPIDSTVRAIRLSDDLGLPPAGFVKVRFIHAAPLTNPVDVTFLRTNVTPFDSITFPSQKYIGITTNVQSLSAFNDLPLGNYILKIKSAGNQDTIMNTIRLSISNLAGTAGISGITTFYLTGGAQGQPLQVGLFRHYP